MVSSRPPKSFGLNKCLIGYSLYFVLALVNYIMTPKEKANELGNKFYQGSVFDYDKQGHLKEIERAKERTKICVQARLTHALWQHQRKTG